MESSAEYLEYFLSRTHLFLLETLAQDGHTASGAQGCLCVPAVSQGTENGMRFGPSGSVPDFAPLCSHLLHSEVPIRKHQGTKPDPEPEDRETLITKPFVWAWSWKSTQLPASSPPGCVMWEPPSVSTQDPQPRGSPPASEPGQDPLPWQGGTPLFGHRCQEAAKVLRRGLAQLLSPRDPKCYSNHFPVLVADPDPGTDPGLGKDPNLGIRPDPGIRPNLGHVAAF